MSNDGSIIAAASALLAQYGDDAEVIAVLRAAEAAAIDDAEALAHWDGVVAALSESGIDQARH
jgi:hypothetical protein